ncbi:HAD-IA family hydrolase [Oceaniglobus roseus]|uniref:HAD-IA family hydrolase n=1 Tax=Oceaniglobus roseus TaxID=1737570 RepID=UPI000C7F15A0|nr:HAD-IA family hydrolase [Kandeliimicrobium roseum]
MRTVIFDLDGTLADTGADLIAAANACFRDLGHGDVLEVARDKGTALRGGRAMLTLGFERLGMGTPEDLIKEQYPLLLGHYAKAIRVHTAFYPGVERAVAALREGGYAVGICTNKPEALAEALMVQLGARDWFASLVGADTLPVRKPDPAPFFLAVERAGGDRKRSVLVGDTKTDRDTARNAGVPSVLVTFGPGRDSVRDLAPEATLDHFDDLGRVVAGLIG